MQESLIDDRLGNCATAPGFLRREHAFVYFAAVSDIITDITRRHPKIPCRVFLTCSIVISIPIIVLRKSSLDLHRKLSIAAVLCLSLLMIAIGLVRAISAALVGTADQTWDTFWVQIEASVSVIAVCPMVYRSLFVINHARDKNPDRINDNHGRGSVFERVWGRKKPSLQSIGVGATLTGMRTVIHGAGRTRLESLDDDGYALSLVVERPSVSLESQNQGVEASHKPV